MLGPKQGACVCCAGMLHCAFAGMARNTTAATGVYVGGHMTQHASVALQQHNGVVPPRHACLLLVAQDAPNSRVGNALHTLGRHDSM
jgi:hypothetical protein